MESGYIGSRDIVLPLSGKCSALKKTGLSARFAFLSLPRRSYLRSNFGSKVILLLLDAFADNIHRERFYDGIGRL
jgi:hypothetical protein